MKSSDQLQSLIEAERGIAPDAGVAERGWMDLQSQIRRGAVPMPVSAESLSLTASGATIKTALTALAIGAAVATGGAALLHRTDEAPSPAIPVASVDGHRPPGAGPAVPAPRPLPAPSTEPTAEAPKRGVPAEPLPSAKPSTFDAELAMIERAKAALNSGRPHVAAVWLNEHAARYPRGVFAVERDGLRIVLTCRNGQLEEGQRQARAFLRRPDRSVLGDHIARACRLEGPNARSPDEGQ
jgi:hypothetical protein